LGVDELSKSALRVYVRLLESDKPLGVRELARELEMPASTVHYCLKRLEELGFVERDEDEYKVKRVEGPEGFVIIRRRLVPRLAIYSAFFLGILVAEATICALSGINPDRAVVMMASLMAFLLFLMEGLRARKKIP